jgi:hypothetical protein
MAAWAAPSLTGPSGLITIPTAEVLGMARWNVGGTAVMVADVPDAKVVYANVGLLPRLELGFARDDVEEGEAETILNAKVGMLMPVPGQVSMAAGVIDISDQIERSGYVVVSHTVGAGLPIPAGPVALPQIHVGVGSGRFDGLFGGVSTVVSGYVTVMAEYDGEDVNVGARWPVARSLEATVAAFGGLEDFGLGLSLSSPW